MADEVLQRLDRLEHHFSVYKTDMTDVKDSLKEVRILLGGSSLNNNKGFIMLMESVERKVEAMELELNDIKKDVDNVKFWGRGAAGLLFGGILVILNVIKEKL